MTNTHWTLLQTLQRHRQKVPALARASGLSKNTVYDIVNGKTKAVTLETVDRLLDGLEQLTGERMTLEAVLGRNDSPDPYAHLFAGVQPFSWEEAQQHVPEWAAPERAENDHFWAKMEADKRARLLQSDKRLAPPKEVFGGESDNLDQPA